MYIKADTSFVKKAASHLCGSLTVFVKALKIYGNG